MLPPFFTLATEISRSCGASAPDKPCRERFTQLRIGDRWLPNTSKFLRAPLLLPASFGRALHQAAVAIGQQAVGIAATLPQRPALAENWPSVIRRSLFKPGESPPPFIQVDFAISTDPTGQPSFRLIELQAFPSVMSSLYLLACWQQDRFALGSARATPADLPICDVIPLLRDCILMGCDPSEVALVEVQPTRQPTYPDLLGHQHLLGIAIEDLADLTPTMPESGKRYVHGRTQGARYRRLYNRVVFEEAEQHGLLAQLAALLESDATWASHPLWYFLISKATLPFLHHPASPPALLCTDPKAAGIEPREWVLKPLYSFGGRGVQLAPTADALNSLSVKERESWILQRRVAYAPLVQTPAGQRFVELRVFLVWPQAQLAPLATFTLFRMNTEPQLNIGQMREPFTGAGVVWFAEDGRR